MNAGMKPFSDSGLDAKELRWASEELATLIRQTEPGSVVSTILTQALRELKSLKAHAEGSIIDQYRTRMVA
jgi:hypothetical protein